MILYFFQYYLGGLGGPVSGDGLVSWRCWPSADLFALEVRHKDYTCSYLCVTPARNSTLTSPGWPGGGPGWRGLHGRGGPAGNIPAASSGLSYPAMQLTTVMYVTNCVIFTKLIFN